MQLCQDEGSRRSETEMEAHEHSDRDIWIYTFRSMANFQLSIAQSWN